MKPANPGALVLLFTLVLVGCADEADRQSPSGDAFVFEPGACEVAATLPVEEVSEDTPFFQPRDIRPLRSLSPLIGNVPNRESHSLNGEWRFIVDQLQIGDVNPLLQGGVGTNQRHGPDELLEYSFDGAPGLRVPGDWNTQHPELFWYRGVIWYQIEFEFEPADDRRQFLYFGGGNYRKDVYVNGQLLARHKGGFTPFNVEVTGHLVAGRNAVTVRVDSLSGPDEVPTEYNDWMNYGGLTREVALLDLPASFIRNFRLQLEKGSLDTITGWVDVDAASSGQPVVLAIPELDFTQEARVDDHGRALFRFRADLRLWSPADPHRYRVEISSAGDRVADQIGFRSIVTEGEQILLNGEPLYLRGVSMHEESLLRPGRAWGPEDAAAAIRTLQGLNANFVRLAHYPHNEYMVRAADAAGILVWSELPVYHNINFSRECTLQEAQRQFAEMIARDQNRAAVVLWSIANETPNTDARNAFLRELAAHVRGLDDSRLLSAALLGFGGMEAIGSYVGKKLAADKSVVARLLPGDDPVRIVIDDPLGEVLDVIGFNEYLGWYMAPFIADALRDRGLEVTEGEVREVMLSEMDKFTLDTEFDKPVIISEFGAGAKHGVRGDGVTVFSEDYQARVYQSQLRMLDNSPAVRGMSPWILKDFRAPYRLHTQFQDYWNRKGLLSETGEPKLAFQVLADHYASLRDEK